MKVHYNNKSSADSSNSKYIWKNDPVQQFRFDEKVRTRKTTSICHWSDMATIFSRLFSCFTHRAGIGTLDYRYRRKDTKSCLHSKTEKYPHMSRTTETATYIGPSSRRDDDQSFFYPLSGRAVNATRQGPSDFGKSRSSERPIRTRQAADCRTRSLRFTQ